MGRLRWLGMARSALALAIALLAVAPGADAGPTATWQGATDTLVCVDGDCRIVSPPADDARVAVGTGGFRQVRLTLDSGTDAPLALQFEQGGREVTTAGREFQRTGWLAAPADRVLDVAVVDLASPWEPTGVREGVPFTLTAEYR
jgi:hypothetical protein